MGKFESTLKSEILRVANREIQATLLPLKREFARLKLRLASLTRKSSLPGRLGGRPARRAAANRVQPGLRMAEVQVSRFTPERIRGLRKKKGLSQRELAVLTGVTLGAVGLWEKGKFAPKPEKKAILLALRKMGKRAVEKMLAEKDGKKNNRKQKATSRRIIKGRRRTKK
jgi:DNA-binding XRE family transcriptional regulator